MVLIVLKNQITLGTLVPSSIIEAMQIFAAHADDLAPLLHGDAWEGLSYAGSAPYSSERAKWRLMLASFGPAKRVAHPAVSLKAKGTESHTARGV